jgi:hypothetical protein
VRQADSGNMILTKENGFSYLTVQQPDQVVALHRAGWSWKPLILIPALKEHVDEKKKRKKKDTEVHPVTKVKN